MRARNWKLPAACLAAALALIASTAPSMADDEAPIENDVRIKVVKCEDGDCKELIEDLAGGAGAEILVGDDMAERIVIRKIHCDREDCEEPTGDHEVILVGADGEVQVLAGGSGYAWISHHGGLGAGGGFLGVGLTELTQELREHFGAPADAGVMVSEVMADSPALRAGLEVGDVIARVDGESIADGSSLGKNIRGRAAGEEVVLSVWRDGHALSITAAVEERKAGMHAGHMDKMHQRMRKIVIECDSDDEDCGSNVEVAGLDDFDCGGFEECEVKVKCKGGGCTCSINGEEADCAGIPGVPGQ